MIIVCCFDPVEGTIYAHRDGEPPCIDVTAGGLIVKHYRDDGILVLELKGQEASLHFYDPDGRPVALRLAPAGQGRWDVIPGS